MTSAFTMMPQGMLRDGSAITNPADVLILYVLQDRRQYKDQGYVRYRNSKILLKKGQACVSQNDLAKATGLTRKAVRCGLERLVNGQILVHVKGQDAIREMSIYFINLVDDEIGQGPRQGPSQGQVRAKSGPTEQEYLDSDSESYPTFSESITDSESHPHICSDVADAPPERLPAKAGKKYDFEEWWKAWRITGTKRGKGSARTQYQAAIRSGKVDHETLCDAVGDFMTHCERAGTPVSKIIHPERWLKRERWSDELVQDDEPWENRNARPANIRPDGTRSPILDFLNGDDPVSDFSDVPRLSQEQPTEPSGGNGANGNLPSSPDRPRPNQAGRGDNRSDSDLEIFTYRR